MSHTSATRLGDVVILNPRLDKLPKPETPISFVPMATVSAEQGRVVAATDRPYAEVSKGYTYFETGDVLVAKITPCFENGKIAQAVLPRRYGFGSTEFHVLRPISDRLDGRYLHHFLRQPFVRVAGERRMTGSGGQRRVPEGFLAGLSIPLQPLPEQRRIAAILDQANALRAKRREALAQLDSLAQAIFIEMFGNPVENPKGWQKRQLGTICEVASSKRVFVEELVDDGIPFYRGTEVGQLGEDREVRPSLFISAEHYERLKSKAGVPRHGDLLLPSICPDGRIFAVESDNPFYFKDGRVLWIKASQGAMNSSFLRHQLKQLFTKNYAQIASGTTFAELKIFALKATEICTPPVDLQLKFARIARCLNLQQSRSRSSMDELDALFASLQHRAFRGEL